MPRELYDNTDFDAMDDPLVAIKKFIQWYRGDGRGENGGAGVPVAPAGSFPIPPYDTVDFTYVSAGAADDDLIETQTFKKDGVAVAVLTYTYYSTTNNIQSIVQS